MAISENVRIKLIEYAERYETAEFLHGDPSWFMHQVNGKENREAMAFLASCLSYGNRKQFMPKIQLLYSWSDGRVADWVRSGKFAEHLPLSSNRCFYRLFSTNKMHTFLQAYREMLNEYGSMGDYVHSTSNDALSAIESICRYFSSHGVSVIVPKNTQSACKRVCLFLRWMVRSNSPVDLGLWAEFIDRRTLIMPLDTHVLKQSHNFGLIDGSSATMSMAKKLTAALTEVFPDDPLKGDFALFGFGVNMK